MRRNLTTWPAARARRRITPREPISFTRPPGAVSWLKERLQAAARALDGDQNCAPGTDQGARGRFGVGNWHGADAGQDVARLGAGDRGDPLARPGTHAAG